MLGGGYVCLELSQAYRRFGSAVTIVEPGLQLIGREPDVAEEMRRILAAEGIQVLLAAEPLRVHGRSGGEVSLVVRTASGEQHIEGSDILVATGRIPNATGIGLEEAGIQLDGRGYIRVNERLEASAPGVGAIGECWHVLDDLKVVGRHVRELREVTSTTGKALFHLRFASYPWPLA